MFLSVRRTIFTLQRKNAFSSANHRKPEVHWLPCNVNHLLTNSFQTTLALAVPLVATTFTNFYWRVIAETDLKDVFTLSLLGICSTNFYNQLPCFCKPQELSSCDFIFEKEKESLKTVSPASPQL